MAAGVVDRGPLWVDGRFTARVREPGSGSGRIVRVGRPFALIGRLPGAEIRIDDPDVEDRHALLILDRRGIFGVDLLSGSGTRFAGAAAGSSWLGAGDVVEIAGRRVEILQLKVDGQLIDPRLSDDDPLGDAQGLGLVDLTLEPLEGSGPPWMLGSTLAFIGRGSACAIRVDDPEASETHAALFRGESGAHVIDLLGRRTVLNGRAVEGASALLDGDILEIGRAGFVVRLDLASTRGNLQNLSEFHANTSGNGRSLARIADVFATMSGSSVVASTGLAPGPRESMLAMLLGAVGSDRNAMGFEVLDVLRRFQSDTATLLEAQIDRIEILNREIMMLREEVRGRGVPPPPSAEPLRIDLTPPPAPSEESATWLIDRLGELETESRSTWKDLLGRIASTVVPRPEVPSKGQDLAPIAPKTSKSREY